MCAEVMWKIVALLPKGSMMPSWQGKGSGLWVFAEAAAVGISAASSKDCSRETEAEKAEEQLMFGSWEITKASGRVFE